MLREKDLQELIEFKSPHPVLSVYLNFDPSLTTTEKAKLRARQMLKDLNDQAPEDAEKIHTYLEQQYDSSGQGLVLFTCQPENFFKAIKLSIPVRNRARLLPKPYVKPLAALLDDFGHYGIVIVDKQKLRVFHFHLGELIEDEGIAGETVRHTKSGGGSQATGRRGGIAGQTRHTEELVDRNLREAADFAAAFFDQKHIRRILVGGAEQITTQFIELLPKRWQSLVLGTFPMDMAAGHAQVLDKARQLADRARKEHEQDLISSVLTAAAKDQGAAGLEQTLRVVYSGNVQTLLIEEGYRASGFRCINCGFITAELSEKCSFCGSQVEEIEDVVEMAVQKVLQDGGDVEIVSPHHKLQDAGHIAATSRYSP